MDCRDIILSTTILRAQDRCQEAINHLESNLAKIEAEDPDILINAYLELIYAAVDCGDETVAVRYARKAAQEDPEIPTIKRILERYS